MSESTEVVKKKRFSLVERTSRHMTRSRTIVLPGNKHFYPSESSVSWIDRNGIKQVSGACMRQAYLRVTGEAKPSKMTAHTAWIFALGKAVEIILVEQWKQMGIWVDNNIKFFNEEYNISGELDCIIRDPETEELCCSEIKSIYGYFASKEIMGTKTEPGRPKTNQLLQLLVYLKETMRQIPYGRLFYAARDSSDRKEFLVELVPDEQDTSILRPMVNGVIDYRFTVNDIYDRFKLLGQYVQNRTMPEADYELVWSPQKIEERYKLGDLGKSKYDKWKKDPKKNPIGDWQCNYCAYTHCCYNKDGTRKL